MDKHKIILIRYISLLFLLGMIYFVSERTIINAVYRLSGSYIDLFHNSIEVLIILILVPFAVKSVKTNKLRLNNFLPYNSIKLNISDMSKLNVEVLNPILHGRDWKTWTDKSERHITTIVNVSNFSCGESIEITAIENGETYEITIVSSSRNFFTISDNGINFKNTTIIKHLLEAKNIEDYMFRSDARYRAIVNGVYFIVILSLMIENNYLFIFGLVSLFVLLLTNKTKLNM